MNPTPSAPAAFEDVLASMTEVDRLKSREEILAAEADLPARIADVTARLKNVYAQQSIAVRDETIAQGVEQFFSQRLVFQPPAPTLGSRLAVLWIFRTRILLAGTALSAFAFVVTAGVYFGVVVPAQEARARELAAVRQEISTTTQKLRSTQNLGAIVFTHAQQEIRKTIQAATDPEMPKAAAVAESQLSAQHAAFEEKLNQAESRLNEVSPAEKIASAQAPTALANAHQAMQTITAAGHGLDEVTALSLHIAALPSARASLESAWQRLDHAGLAPGLRASGELEYAKGLTLVTEFAPAADVQAATAQLNAFADAETRLRAFPTDLKAAAAAARAISRDPRADAQIPVLERAGLAAAESGDVATAEKNLLALRVLAARLGESYAIRIVNRRGEYTRFWRNPPRSSTVRNYYVVVEALAADGSAVPVTIRSEEDGSSGTVSKWAERVDPSTYDRVGRDKQDDGIVQENNFGQKEKGLLAPTYRLGPKTQAGDTEAGRIYRWEYKG